MTTTLQDTIDNLVKQILEYDSDTWNSKANDLTKEQAESIASSLIDDWVIEELDGWGIKERYNDLKLGETTIQKGDNND
jgi:hypothetical protein